MSDYNSMPNPLSPDVDKNSKEFGLSTLKTCYDSWKSGFGKESAQQRRERFDYNRAFMRGKHPMNEYRDMFEVSGQKISFLNLDFTPIKVAIAILGRIKDRFIQRNEKITCASIDPFTQSKKKKAKEDALFKLKNKEKIMALQQQAGVQLEEFSETDPEDEQEVEIQFGHNYKVGEEILMQNLIDIVFYDNKFSEVEKSMMLNHLICCGYAITKTKIDANGRIKTPIVKPDNFVTSCSEWDDFRDWQWQGEVHPVSIQEIRLKYPGKISEEELYNLAKSQSGKNGNGTWNGNWEFKERLAQPWDGFNILLLDLTYKTLYSLNYEKNKDRFGKELLDKASKVKPGKEYEKSKPYDVSYTGCWIVDTDHLLEWGLSKNMIKPEQNLTEIYSPYTVYMYDNDQMQNTPLMETMIPSIKLMQNLHLQAQKVIASTAPPGYTIDLAKMSDIDMGEGVGVVSPMQLYEIYLQTGDRYWQSTDDNGENNGNPPIMPSNNVISNQLEQLDAKWQREYDKLVVMVGSNNIANGNITNQAIGKTVLNDAKQIGESSTNFLYNSYLNVLKGTAKRAQMLGWDILVYGKKGYEGYKYALGDDKVEYLKLEATDDFEKTQFDVKIEAVIDDAEQQRLQEKINICLGQKEITLQDAIDVEQLAKSNIKYASQILAARLRKREKDMIKQKQADIEANNQAAQISAQEASKGAMDLEQMQFQNKMELMKEETRAMQEREVSKYSSILKSNVATAILSKEGSTINDLPDFVFEGVDLSTTVNRQIMMEQIQQQQQDEAAEQQAMEQQAMAQQQQQMPPEQM